MTQPLLFQHNLSSSMAYTMPRFQQPDCVSLENDALFISFTLLKGKLLMFQRAHFNTILSRMGRTVVSQIDGIQPWVCMLFYKAQINPLQNSWWSESPRPQLVMLRHQASFRVFSLFVAFMHAKMAPTPTSSSASLFARSFLMSEKSKVSVDCMDAAMTLLIVDVCSC